MRFQLVALSSAEGSRFGVRKVKEGQTTDDLFAFLTTEPNAVVAPIHSKAMPAILQTPEGIGVWMTEPGPGALELQRATAGQLAAHRRARPEAGRARHSGRLSDRDRSQSSAP